MTMNNRKNWLTALIFIMSSGLACVLALIEAAYLSESPKYVEFLILLTLSAIAVGGVFLIRRVWSSQGIEEVDDHAQGS